MVLQFLYFQTLAAGETMISGRLRYKMKQILTWSYYTQLPPLFFLSLSLSSSHTHTLTTPIFLLVGKDVLKLDSSNFLLKIDLRITKLEELEGPFYDFIRLLLVVWNLKIRDWTKY